MMTDGEVRQQVERADCFIEQLRDLIHATIVDPASLCADAQRRGLRRIADTLDAVPYVTMLIEVHLKCVGGGPTLDHADAAAFLAAFQPMIDMTLRRRLQ
jgi:hypothetical protein